MGGTPGSRTRVAARRVSCETLESRTLLSASLVKDINTLTLSSGPSAVVVSGGKTYFAASDVAGPGLWRTDGTDAGTVLIKPLPATNVSASNLTDVSGTLFFVNQSNELWKSDGTLEG